MFVGHADFPVKESVPVKNKLSSQLVTMTVKRLVMKKFPVNNPFLHSFCTLPL